MTIYPSLQKRSLSVDTCGPVRQSMQRPMYQLMVSALMGGMAIVASGAMASAAWVSSDVRELSQAAPSTLMSQLPGPITLQRNDSGNAVSALQRRLTELGFYNGPITGFFGELTESAVRDFQSSRGLTVDGVVGPSTTEALRGVASSTLSSTSRPAGVLTNGATGSEVRQVQTRLTELGFYTGPITGFYGELTEAAVRSFQSSNGLAIDGAVGPVTLAAMQQGSQRPVSSAPDPNDGLLEQGETGPAVANLQRRLRNLNYYNGPIDGDFGRLTADAVLRFQRAQGLVADGVVGPATLAAISRVESGTAGVSSRSVGTSSGTVSNASSSTVSSQTAVVEQPSVTATPPRNQTTAFPAISSNPFPSSGGTSIPSGASIASPEAVMALQRNLADQGFYNGPIDGVMSFETQQAIAAARSAYGVDSTDFDGGNPL